MNVLITAVSGPTAIGIIKCLKKYENFNLIGTDIYLNSIGKKWLNKLFKVSKNTDIDKYEKELKTIIKNENIDIIFPTMQEELELVEKIAQEEKIYSATVKGYPLNRLLNKKIIYEDLKKMNLSKYVPKYEIINNKNDILKSANLLFQNEKFICIKNTVGHGGKGFSILALNKKDYLDNLEKGFLFIEDYIEHIKNNNSEKELLLSEYIDGEEISVDLLRHNKKIISIVTRIRSRVSTGIVIDGYTSKKDQIIEAASIIADNFKIEGFVNMQFIVNNNGIYLIDLNPRFCGSQVMSFGAGVNFPKMICDIVDKKSLDVIEPQWNIETRRYWESVFYDENGNII